MPDALVHPIPEQFAGFALGKAAQAEAAVIGEHLAESEDCQEAVAALPHDSVVALLRSAPSSAFEQQPRIGCWLPVELADHPRYPLLEWFGAGGNGVDYHAEHRLMDRRGTYSLVQVS